MLITTENLHLKVFNLSTIDYKSKFCASAMQSSYIDFYCLQIIYRTSVHNFTICLYPLYFVSLHWTSLDNVYTALPTVYTQWTSLDTVYTALPTVYTQLTSLDTVYTALPTVYNQWTSLDTVYTALSSDYTQWTSWTQSTKHCQLSILIEQV